MPRLAYFVGLGVVMITAHALARTAAEGIFLANAGPEALPLYFVLVGIGAAPIAAGATRLIDRLPRARLYQASQLGAIPILVGLRVLVGTQTTAAYYGVLIGVVVVEMLMNIQFWVLVADYFTTLEQKRIVPFLTIGAAAGTMLGGTLATLLTRFVSAPDVLLAFGVLYLAGFGVFHRLRTTQVAVQTEEEPEGPDRQSASAEVWELVRRYPVVVLMAAVGFLEVMLGGLGSYLSYSVYSDAFPTERELTAFLGTMRASLSVLQVLVIFFLTRPLVHRMGVGRMNLIYPSTSVGSLGALALVPGLPTAILAHVNFSTVAVGIAGPVENLTYNAVPPRFLGRVRTVSEALLQPTGLAAGGLLLVALQHRLSFRGLALVTLAVAGVMLVLGVLRARAYLRALQAQLGDRSLDLTRDDDYLSHLHGKYADEVHDLLDAEDPDGLAVGIELAARIDADRFLPEVTPRLAGLRGPARAAAVTLMGRVQGASGRRELLSLLDAVDPTARAAALEGLLAGGGVPREVDVRSLVSSPDAVVRGLGVVAAYRSRAEEDPGPVLEGLDGEGLDAAVRAVSRHPAAEALPVLLAALERGSATAREGALRTLTKLLPAGAEAARPLVLEATSHEDAEVRSAAYELLAREGVELAQVSDGFQDPSARVRARVAKAMGDAGRPALLLIQAALESHSTERVRSALRALGHMRTTRAADIAFAYLQQDYRRANRCAGWLARVPRDDPHWEPVRVTLEDATRRAVDRVLEVLGSFGHERTLRHARMALASRDERLRANAVETLASLPDRRFVLPVMNLLEALAARSVEAAGGEEVPLDELVLLDDPWVRSGAAATLDNLGRSAPDGVGKDVDMSRLLFLKRVGLFQELSLDSLMALDESLRREDFLTGETIFAEGSAGGDLYVVLQGEVIVQKDFGGRTRELARIGRGEFFGEMALWDDEPRSATCVAAEATTLLSLNRMRFYSLIEQLPRLGIEISRVLSIRLRRTTGSLLSSGADAS